MEKETNLNQEKIENENSVEKLAEQVETIIKNNSIQDEEYDEDEEISVNDIEENEYLAADYDIDNETTEDDEFSIKNNEYLAADYDINNEIAEDDEENQEDSQIESNEYLAADYGIGNQITENEEDDFLNEDDGYLLNRYTDSDDNFGEDTFESLIQEVQQTLDNISVTGKKHKHSMYTLPIKEEFFEELIEKEETNPVKEVTEEVKNYTEDIKEPLGGVYSVDEKKPLIESSTLKDQTEHNNTVEIIEEEKDVDVPIGGSFDAAPANVTVSGTLTQKRKKKEVVYPQSPILTVDDPDEEFVSNPDLYVDDFGNNVTDPDDEVTFVAVDNGIKLKNDYVKENNFIDVLELDDDDTEEVVSDKSVEVAEEVVSEKTTNVIEEAVSDETVEKDKQVEIVNQVSKDIIKTDAEKLNSVFEDIAEKQTNETLTDIYKEDVKETAQDAEMISNVETLSEEVNIEESKVIDVPAEEIEVVSDVEPVSEPISKEADNVPAVEEVSQETTKLVSEEENKTSATEKTKTVADNNVIIDKETNEEIDIEKEYSLDEEKSLTGSFKLKEQLEKLIEKDIEALDIPLSRSFGVEPVEVTVSGSYKFNDEKSANTELKPVEEVATNVVTVSEPVKEVASTVATVLEPAKEVVATVATVSEPVSKEAENVSVVEKVSQETTELVSGEENKASATEETETVADNNVIIDKEANEEIDIEKEYSLDEEKPLTGSFKLKEQLEKLIKKDVETLDVPLSGSFGVEPAEVTVSGSYNSNDEKSANAEPKPAEEVEVVSAVATVSEKVESVAIVEEVTEKTTELVSEEENKTSATEKTETVADNNVIIDKETNEEIDIEKEYSLDEEKPLTGSFKLKEQLEKLIEKDVETLDVPLSGSFGVEPAEVTVSGSYNSNDEKSANAEPKPVKEIAANVVTVSEPVKEVASTVATVSKSAKEVVATVATVSEPVSKEAKNVSVVEKVSQETTELVSEEENKTSATEKTETVADNNVIIDKETNEEIDIEKEYSLDEEKPLTGSFKLKEQLEKLIEKDVETLDVPLSGSFGVEPAEVTVSGSYNFNDEKSANAEPKPVNEIASTVAIVSKPVKEVASTVATELEPAKEVVATVAIVSKPVKEVASTVATVSEPVSKEAENVSVVEKVSQETTELVSEEENKASATEETETVADNNVIIGKETNEEIDIEKEYSLDEEKPLTGSFKLKEQLEKLIEKDVETLDVPLSGSFGVEPAEVTVSGKYELRDSKINNTDDEETISFVEGEKYDIDSIMDAIIRAANLNGSRGVSPTKFAEQVRNILEKNY